MANPNIVSVTSIKGESIGEALTTTTTTDIMTVAADKLVKINYIQIANDHASTPITATVAIVKANFTSDGIGSGDSILVGASIFAEADATFSGTVNSTDLVFATGDSAAASEKFRIDSTGICTFVDGAVDVDIASHDGTNGLKLAGTLVSATAEALNNIPNQATLGKCIALSLVFAQD